MNIDKLHEIWRRVRGPFLLPQCVCLHDGHWEPYDFGQAGCRRCGARHHCDSGQCSVETSHEGQDICTITGLCLSMLNLSDMEVVESSGGFVSREVLDNTYKNSSHPGDHQWLEEQVYQGVHHILCSEAWSACREVEVLRYSEKCAAIMIRHLKSFKQHDKGRLPIMPNLVAQFYEEINSTPAVVGEVSALQRAEMCAICVRVIIQQIKLLQLVQPSLMQAQRIQGVIVGLLYLLRVGVTCKGICVLPRIAHLTKILPSESNLFEFFRIRSKCITDCENLIKHLLRTKPATMLKNASGSVLQKQNLAPKQLLERPQARV